MIGERSYHAHVWRLGHDVDWLSDMAGAALLQQMIRDTPEPDRQAIAKLCADAETPRHSEPWQRALRVMRELRWSSY
jgi:hypothetical protein